jgi:hypothetical protein
MTRNRRVSASQDLQDESLHGIGVKSMFESDHLVEDAPQTPNIRFLVVRLLLTDLGREVVRCANSCLRTVISVLEDPGNPEISNFDGSLLSHENVLSFQVSVEDLLVVNMLNGEGHLNEPIEDLVLAVADYG